jgi:HNH endonuclease
MSDCIESTGWAHKDGYRWEWDSATKREVLAHRLAWERRFGPIPEGLVIMHVCDNRACKNLDHLVLGTQGDNVRDMITKGRDVNRKREQTHCIHGHEFTEANTYIRPNGTRHCKTCGNKRKRVRRE